MEEEEKPIPVNTTPLTWRQKYLGSRVPYYDDNEQIQMFKYDVIGEPGDGSLNYESVEKAVADFWNLNCKPGQEVGRLTDWESIVVKGVLDDQLYVKKQHRMATTPYEFRGYPKPIVDYVYFVVKRADDKVVIHGTMTSPYSYPFNMRLRYYGISSLTNEKPPVDFVPTFDNRPSLPLGPKRGLSQIESVTRVAPGGQTRYYNFVVEWWWEDYMDGEIQQGLPFLFRGSFDNGPYGSMGHNTDPKLWYAAKFAGPHIKQIGKGKFEEIKAHFAAGNNSGPGYYMPAYEIAWNRILGLGGSLLNFDNYDFYIGTEEWYEKRTTAIEGEPYIYLVSKVYKLKDGRAVITAVKELRNFAGVELTFSTSWTPAAGDIAPEPW